MYTGQALCYCTRVAPSAEYFSSLRSTLITASFSDNPDRPAPALDGAQLRKHNLESSQGCREGLCSSVQRVRVRQRLALGMRV
ncbi:hypothetical protein NDU88_007934 [Pleurodeles waltl]|uniref:Uncharacterized protein n=1 Tax=Pleurodeles waltl TaxID=8319 RepID=A0AAV7N7B2_PLEWA|nr:hypothetical protein NDU88_007934 [Pleurodeles waltl]